MATKGTSFIEDGNYLIFRPFFCQPWYISSCFILVYVTGMLANLFMLVVIGKDPKICLRTRSSYLITNLIISDFVGAVMNTYRILHQISVDALRDSKLISYVHKPTVIIAYAALLVSLSTVLLISVERLLAIIQPLRFKVLVTKKLVAFAAVATWLICASVAVILFYIPGRNHVFQGITVLNILLLVSLPTIYTKAFYSLRKQQLAADNLNSSSGNGERKEKRILQQKKFLLTSVTLILVYLITCAPFTIYNYKKISESGLHNPYNTNDELVTGFWIILSLNLCIDPFLYCLRIPQYRKSCLALITKQ